MKISIWWLLAVPVLIAGIASSQAGFSVVWDYEMKRPEAQKAMEQYLRTHCSVLSFAVRDKTITADDLNQLKIQCWSDEHQK